jgi:exodeoxyribonuclease V alpha subunit
VVVEGEAVYLRSLYQAERGASDTLKVLLSQPLERRHFDTNRASAWAEESLGLQLTPDQRRAVEMAVSKKVSVITGGPGTGKTTILRAVLMVLHALKARMVLAAPTSRAAKRLSEATGHEAKTLHRLLDFRPGEGKFRHDQDYPLPADAVIVDETSMVDTVLLYHLLKSVPPAPHSCW